MVQEFETQAREMANQTMTEYQPSLKPATQQDKKPYQAMPRPFIDGNVSLIFIFIFIFKF